MPNAELMPLRKSNRQLGSLIILYRMVGANCISEAVSNHLISDAMGY